MPRRYEEDETITVEVPCWALNFVLDHADFCDRGPAGEGWSSAKMECAVKALTEAFGKKGV